MGRYYSIGLFVKIFRLKDVKDYEVQKMFFKSDEYIQHKKKWMKKFLYPLLICGLSWGFLRIVGMNEALPISVSHFVMIVCYAILGTKEAKARKVTRQKFLDRTIVYPSIDVKFEFNHQRRTPVKDGYRADHRFDEQHIAIGVHHYQGVNQISPGESAFGTISFVAPEYYPHSLYEGKEILIQEGEKIVGRATVIKVNSPILKKEITFEDITKVFAVSVGKTACIEIEFMLSDSDKFCQCWTGKLYDNEIDKEIYWFGLTEDGLNAYDYTSFEEMSQATVFDGKSLKDVWDDVKIISIDGCEPEERVEYYSNMILENSSKM